MVSVQLPVPLASTSPLQVSVPSVTCTVPAGVPPPEVTENATTNWPPTLEGSGESSVIVVVVVAGGGGAAACTSNASDVTLPYCPAVKTSLREPGSPVTA